MQLVIAEKPSVARDLARVLGLRGAGKAAIEDSRAGCVITWCVGHLVELEEPAAYDDRWKAWRLDTLPMLPSRFKLRPVSRTRDQLRAVRELLRERRFTEVVNACDAGREGELIFRYVYELAGCRLPVKRLWISSMTDEAIRAGFGALRPGEHYDPLADAARCRSEADWLVGLNATRAVTLRRRQGERSTLYSIGRVQTPTLAIVVGRDAAIRDFVPRDYWEVRGRFKRQSGEVFDGLWTVGKVTRLGGAALAQAVVERDSAGASVVEKVERRKTREPPPLLFDLTSLQRTANRRFGLSAQRTLEVAQALYEKHKVLTYPRTDARHLSSDLAATVPGIFRGLAAIPEYRDFVAPLHQQPIVRSRRIFDDGAVHDHHAIIPTGKAPRREALDRDEARIFDLVVRRFLGAFYSDAEFANMEVIVRVESLATAPATGSKAISGDGAADREAVLETLPPPPDRFAARGRARIAVGWQAVAGYGDESEKSRRGQETPAAEREGEQTLPDVREGERLQGAFASEARKTKPPPHHTEATLLAAMETAGRSIGDDELRQAMKDCGLGTPATRAATIETLLKRGFLVRQGKHLRATPTGEALIAGLPLASLSSPELTGRWEARLARIARGQETRADFMRDIASYVREVVDAIRRGTTSPPSIQTSAAAAPVEATKSPSHGPSVKRRAGSRPDANDGTSLPCPRCREGTLVTGKRGWGCSRWRQGCPFVVWFETAGKRLTHAQLADLVTRGKTRKGKFSPTGADAISGRLVLDLGAAGGAARFQAG